MAHPNRKKHHTFGRRMEWIMDPTIWIGLSTLIVLEIVLGIDNIVFIAILAEKLPPEKRDHARIAGLSINIIIFVDIIIK